MSKKQWFKLHELDNENKCILLACIFFKRHVDQIYGQRRAILDLFSPETFWDFFRISEVDNTDGDNMLMIEEI